MSNENGSDVEALLSPSMKESPELKWWFIRKVYSIVIVQLIATIGVAAAVAFVPSIFSFFSNPWAGWGFYVLLLIILTIVIIVLVVFKDKYPHNFILLGIFTLCFGLVLGLVTTFIKGIIIVEAGIVTIVVILSLLAYTFWASWRRQLDLGFLVPFLQSVVVIVVSFTVLEIYFPTGHVSDAIYSGIIVLLFSTFIIADTDALIDLHLYHDYIIASITLYLDVLNVFSRLTTLIRACCRR